MGRAEKHSFAGKGGNELPFFLYPDNDFSRLIIFFCLDNIHVDGGNLNNAALGNIL